MFTMQEEDQMSHHELHHHHWKLGWSKFKSCCVIFKDIALCIWLQFNVRLHIHDFMLKLQAKEKLWMPGIDMFQQKNASHPRWCTRNAQSKTLVMLINPLNAIITSNSQSSSKRQKNHDSVKLLHFAFNAFESLRSE